MICFTFSVRTNVQGRIVNNGLESAGRALSHGLHPYRIDCRHDGGTTLVVQIYHPREPLLLIRTTLTNADASNAFTLNATVASLRVQLDALAAYVTCVVLADGGDCCRRA